MADELAAPQTAGWTTMVVEKDCVTDVGSVGSAGNTTSTDITPSAWNEIGTNG
jgi:hypothetical protein